MPEGGESMKATQPPQPWERQPKETDVAFEAFTVYRDMGADRSYVKVSQKLGKSRTIIDRWGRTHGWAVRINDVVGSLTNNNSYIWPVPIPENEFTPPPVGSVAWGGDMFWDGMLVDYGVWTDGQPEFNTPARFTWSLVETTSELRWVGLSRVFTNEYGNAALDSDFNTLAPSSSVIDSVTSMSMIPADWNSPTTIQGRVVGKQLRLDARIHGGYGHMENDNLLKFVSTPSIYGYGNESGLFVGGENTHFQTLERNTQGEVMWYIPYYGVAIVTTSASSGNTAIRLTTGRSIMTNTPNYIWRGKLLFINSNSSGNSKTLSLILPSAVPNIRWVSGFGLPSQMAAGSWYIIELTYYGDVRQWVGECRGVA